MVVIAGIGPFLTALVGLLSLSSARTIAAYGLTGDTFAPRCDLVAISGGKLVGTAGFEPTTP